MSAGLSIAADPLDLIPGSTEAPYDDAPALETRAEELEAAAAGVRRRTVAGWVGDAADDWDERRLALASAMDAPAGVYRSAAEVLRAHAATIEWAREECHVAIALWRKGEAERSYDGLQCLAGPAPIGAPQQTVVDGQRWSLGLDPGYETRAQALRVLEAAREEVRLSAEAAAALLDTWCADLPDGQFHAEGFWGGVWSWVCAIGTLLRTYNAARAMYDPGGYAHDVGAAAQGVQDLAGHLAANPHDVNRVVLDSETWRDNPGRWWGSIAPDLALGVVGGGAGVVSRITRATDIPNGVAKVPDGTLPQPGAGSLEIVGRGFSSSELRAATELEARGHIVVLREADGVVKTSDLLVDGVPYDVYSPRTGNVSRLVSAIAEKAGQVDGGGVVVDLTESPLRLKDVDVDSLLARVKGVTPRVTDIIVIKGE